MRYLLATLFLVVGCSRSTPRAESGPRLESGDRVVARVGGGFQEATVLFARGKLVSLATDGASDLRLPRSWVTPLVLREELIIGGEWRLCAVGEEWRLCHAERAPGESLQLAYVGTDGARHFADSWTLPVPSGVQLWAEREGRRRLDHARLADILPRLEPEAAGTFVTVGQTVVARWNGGGWWSGTVLQHRGAQIVVGWGDGSPASVLSAAEVAPAPTGAGFQDGAFVMCRYGSTSFAAAQISGASGAQTAIFGAEQSTPVTPSDCIAARMR